MDTLESLCAERDALKADIGRLLVAYGSRDEFDGIDEAIADALAMRQERDAARAEVERLQHNYDQCDCDRDRLKRECDESWQDREALRARVQATIDGTDCVFCGYPEVRGHRGHDCGCPWNEAIIDAHMAEHARWQDRVAELEKALAASEDHSKVLLRDAIDPQTGKWWSDRARELERALDDLLHIATLFNRESDDVWVALRDRCRALLSAPAQAPTADKNCLCAKPRSASGTLCWDCGRPLRVSPAQEKEEP